MDLAWLFVAALLILCTYLLMRNRMAIIANQSLLNMNRQLREQNQQLVTRIAHDQSTWNTLLETMIDPVFMVNTERSITVCNSAARRLTRGAAQPGLSLMQTLRSYELDSVVEETLDDKHDLPREITINERLYRAHVSVLSSDGVKEGAILILRDISDLQRLGRARRDFVANISHEIRTPLTAIRLLVDTLRMSDGKDAVQRANHLDQISSQVDALTQLAQEMYDLSQIESGQVPMRMVQTSVRELADRSITRLAPQAERAGTELSNEIGDDVRAFVDPEQISRVLSNLLHNAIKFAPHGSVTVYIAQAQPPQPSMLDTSTRQAPSAPDDYLTVAVRDTGVGVSKSDLPRIFERFYKVSRARGQGGTGLGLAIAKHIVEAHGGRIWVESVEGKGATFYFTVPKDE